MCRRAIKLLLLSAVLGLPSMALAVAPALGPAASAPATQAQIAALQQAIQSAQAASASAQSAGDNAWMLVSAALVLLMTGPGLALFYGGLVRKKNMLGTMMQSFAMMGLITILWAVVGYSLAFGHGNAFIGGFEHAFLRGVGLAPNTDYAATIPEQTYMIYQLMFAIITPALITGAFAERMKFSAMAVFLASGPCWSIAPWPTWSGAWAASSTPPAAIFPASTSPAERWFISPAASLPWSPASTSANASATPTPTCPRTPWCSASSAPACSG
jgi:Amt family ammonium transporter